MGEAVASLALGVQPDRTAIARFPIASAPGVFDFAGLREVDANVFDVGFTEHVGPGLAEDPRFNTPGGRAVNATERILLMAEIIKKRPTADWLQRLDANDVP